jgi:hypothetical protein
MAKQGVQVMVFNATFNNIVAIYIIIDIKFLNIEFDASCIYDYLEISESGIY